MASHARTLQCILEPGSPPSASAMCSFVIVRACFRFMPMIISVAYELVAIAALQPWALNFASMILSAVDPEPKLHDIATHRIAHLRDCIGIFNFAHAAGIFKIVDQLCGIRHIRLACSTVTVRGGDQRFAAELPRRSPRPQQYSWS